MESNCQKFTQARRELSVSTWECMARRLRCG